MTACDIHAWGETHCNDLICCVCVSGPGAALCQKRQQPPRDEALPGGLLSAARPRQAVRGEHRHRHCQHGNAWLVLCDEPCCGAPSGEHHDEGCLDLHATACLWCSPPAAQLMRVLPNMREGLKARQFSCRKIQTVHLATHCFQGHYSSLTAEVSSSMVQSISLHFPLCKSCGADQHLVGCADCRGCQ